MISEISETLVGADPDSLNAVYGELKKVKSLDGRLRPRPLSPHLTIYWRTMMMPIVHRIAGAALLCGGLSRCQKVRHRMRLTAAANVPLAQFLIVSVVALVGADYATAVGYVGGPLVVVPLLLLVLSGTWHARIGMQAIFKDCVHDNLLYVLVLALNNFFPQQLQSVPRMRC